MHKNPRLSTQQRQLGDRRHAPHNAYLRAQPHSLSLWSRHARNLTRSIYSTRREPSLLSSPSSSPSFFPRVNTMNGSGEIELDRASVGEPAVVLPHTFPVLSLAFPFTTASPLFYDTSRHCLPAHLGARANFWNERRTIVKAEVPQDVHRNQSTLFVLRRVQKRQYSRPSQS